MMDRQLKRKKRKLLKRKLGPIDAAIDKGKRLGDPRWYAPKFNTAVR